MPDNKNRVEINLKASMCVENPTGSDIYAWNDPEAQHVKNNGIEREGGITNLYETETTFPTAGVSTMIAKDGTVIQVDSSNNVRLNDHVIGNVGPLAIAQRGVLSGYLDAAWTADATLLAINRVGTSMYVYEIDPATGLVLHSRSNVFAGFPAGKVVNICLVKYVDMHYADNQEFIVQLGGQIFLPEANAYILKESGTSTTVITGSLNHPFLYFCWRFSASKYISGKQNVIASWYIGDLIGAGDVILSTGAPTLATEPTNVIIDRFPGTAFSRAILTLAPVKNNANLFSGYGEVGYTSAGVYSATPVFYGVALGAVTATVQNPIFGLGYSECAFTRSDTGLIYYYYAAPFAHNVAAYYLSAASGTNTPINGYGKLTDLFNTTSGANNTNLVAWRVGWINGQPSFLSAAPIGSKWDCIGVPITNVGEFDEIFTPHIDDNGSTYSRILYRYNGQLFYVNITSSAIHTLQKVSDNLHTVNCLSAINAIDIKNKRLSTGSNDYNGRLIQYNAGAAPVATYKIVGQIKETFSNSIDFGDKLSTSIPLTNGPILLFGSFIFCPGIESPSFSDRPSDFSVDIYTNDVYFGSFIAYGAPIVKADLAGILYVPDTRLPFAMGYQFQERTMQTEVETILTGAGVAGSADIDFDYLCYELGNDLPALYQSFVLFGQTYLFDGDNIWFASFNGSLFAGRGSSPVCTATGMQLIAVSPTQAYFLSAFDNSVWIFNGGRSLIKLQRFNSLLPIQNGVYNTRDGALIMQNADSFIWARDGVLSVNPKKANQTSISLYSTNGGVMIANNTKSWNYSWLAGAGAVVALSFQSSYFGFEKNVKTNLTGIVITFYSPTRASLSLLCTVSTFDTDTYDVQTVPFDISPSDYTDLNLARVRIKPKVQRALATSIGIDCASKVIIVDVIPEFTEDVAALQSGSRSK